MLTDKCIKETLEVRKKDYMPATIHDIAKLSGVSKSTVSRALNGSSLISEETRKKVLEAAKILNYKPNAIARAMVTKRTGNVAFLLYNKQRPFVAHTFYGDIIDTVMEQLSKNNYNMFLSATNDYRSTFSDQFVQRMIDGAILASHNGDAVVRNFKKHNVPIVLLNSVLDYDDLCCVVCDNYNGAYKAVEYLINEKCHRNIGLISGPLNHDSYALRYKAYIDAHMAYDVNVDYNNVRISESSIIDGYNAMNSILNNVNKPSAIFAVTDVLAIGAMKAIRKAGLRIPDDISVIGFDDIEYSSIIEPKLSTVWVDKETMGKLAVETLLRLISGEKIENRILCAETKLIIRDST